MTVYRIAQEQLTNVLKHAYASHVLVTLSCTGSVMSLVITDDGAGFDVKQRTNGMGISNMINRTSLFNGAFFLDSEKGKGSTLTVSFPVIYIEGKCRLKEQE